MTEKENFLKMLRGECPGWIPVCSRGKIPSVKKDPPVSKLGPSILFPHLETKSGRDIWGVEYIATRGAFYTAIPKPDRHILRDIRKWHDVIKAPDISDINWEAMAKKDLDKSRINPNETAVCLTLHIGYFQNLMAFMGFTEGLCAINEEPEAVKELFDYLCTFYITVAKRYIDYLKPDIMGIMDDTAAYRNPFISPRTYRDLLKPYYTRQAKVGIDREIPIEMHNCGKCEDFIDDWFDFGIREWNPAQPVNNLKEIKAKYGNSLVLCGCWDASGKLADPNCPEDFFKESVRKTIDTYAPGGGFCWAGYVPGAPEDAGVRKKNKWIEDVVSTYGKIFYQ